MDESEKRQHVTSQQLVEYRDNELSESEAEHLEIHLAQCDACAEWARESNTLLARMEGWTARAHGYVSSQALIIRALNAAAAEDHPGIPSCKSRIEEWRSALSKRAQETVSGAIQTARDTSAKFADAAAQLFFPPEAWGPNLQPATATRIRGSEASAASTSAIRVILDPSALPAGVTVNLAIDEHLGEVEVRLDRFPPDNRPPLMLLASQGEAGRAQIGAFEYAAQGDYLMARFKEVDPGDYLARIEPSPSTQMG